MSGLTHCTYADMFAFLTTHTRILKRKEKNKTKNKTVLFFTTDLPRKSCREPHPEHKTRLQPAPSRLLLLLPHNPGHTRTALPASPISADGSVPRGGTHGAPHGSFIYPFQALGSEGAQPRSAPGRPCPPGTA